MDAVTSRLPGAAALLARFSTVSLASTGLTLVAIAVLTDVAGVSNAEAAALATFCGFVCSYPMTRNWVFSGRAGANDRLAVLLLGGLSVAGVLLSTLAGALVDAAAGAASIDSGRTLVCEEVAEAAVLGALFVVRFQIARALFEDHRSRR